jgi:hypothetical protein
MQVLDAVQKVFDELNVVRRERVSDLLLTRKGYIQIAQRYLNESLETYNMLMNCRSPEELSAQLLRLSLVNGEYVIAMRRDHYTNPDIISIMGHSVTELFQRRAELALSAYQYYCLQEQLIENGKLREASLRPFSFIRVMLDIF